MFDTVIIVSRTKTDTLRLPLDEYFETKTSTTAFLIIRNDTILFENYYRGYDRTKISTVFSVSKSVSSLLTGIAVDDGYIESVHDPVKKYIPELSSKDPRFGRLTIEHLLDMRSGFKFEEQYSRPFSKIASLYYDTNSLGKMKRMRFESEPGTGAENGEYNYQSATTVMLGLVVQRATGRNFADYMQAKVWTPMGMENTASWSIDDRRHRTAKADCGLNTTARDLAKIGRLYLHGGDWNGTRIVDEAWVTRSVTPNLANGGYQYQWYSMWERIAAANNPDRQDGLWPDAGSAEAKAREVAKREGYDNWGVNGSDERGWWVTANIEPFFAVGILGQFVYVDPAKKIIIVRLGERADIGVSLLHGLAKNL